jgi:transposase
MYKRKKHLPNIRKMPDDLWDEIRPILPPEKLDKTIGRLVVPFRNVLDGILYVLRTGCQ